MGGNGMRDWIWRVAAVGFAGALVVTLAYGLMSSGEAREAVLVAEKEAAEVGAERDALQRKVQDYEAILGWRDLLTRAQTTEALLLKLSKMDQHGSALNAIQAINAAAAKRQADIEKARAMGQAMGSLGAQAADGAPEAAEGQPEPEGGEK